MTERPAAHEAVIDATRGMMAGRPPTDEQAGALRRMGRATGGRMEPVMVVRPAPGR